MYIYIYTGKTMCIGMVYLAFTGIIGDIIRLTILTQQNDVYVPGLENASTYSDRLTFMFMGFVVLNALYQSIYAKNIPNTSQIFASKLKYFSVFICPIITLIFGIIIHILCIISYPFWGEEKLRLSATIIICVNVYFWIKYLYFNPNKFGDIPKLDRLLLHNFNMVMLSGFAWYASFGMRQCFAFYCC